MFIFHIAEQFREGNPHCDTNKKVQDFVICNSLPFYALITGITLQIVLYIQWFVNNICI